MKLLDYGLIVLLIVQIGLWRSNNEAELDTVQLERPDLILRDVETIEIVKGDDRLTLRKSGTQWVMPAYKDYPVIPRAAESLIARIAGYFPGPVVGSGVKDARTYRVGSTKPHMRLKFKDSAGKIRTISMAPAPGNSDYVRADGDDRIFRLEPPLSRQIDTNPKLWIQPHLYRFNQMPSKISFSMGGGQEYTIGSDGRNFRCLNEILDENKVLHFVKSMATLPIDEPIGLVPQGESNFSPMTIFFDFPDKPLRLHLWHHMHPFTGVSGFRVRLNNDPREVFVLAHRFGNLFNMGLVKFLPDDRIPKDGAPIRPR